MMKINFMKYSSVSLYKDKLNAAIFHFETAIRTENYNIIRKCLSNSDLFENIDYEIIDGFWDNSIRVEFLDDEIYTYAKLALADDKFSS